ncbi:retrotransposon protein, putative, ty1-copia subclass [Tanacetum coccineum]
MTGFARLVVLRVEKKMHVIEQPLPPAPEAGAEPNIVAQWTALYDAHTEIACLMLGSMTPELHRQFELHYPYDMVQELRSMFEKQAGMEKKANKKSLNAKGKNKVNGKGKDKKVYIPKPNNPKPTAKERPAKDDACHHCKKVGHWKRNCPVYLAELQKKRKQVGSASSSGSKGSWETRSSFVPWEWVRANGPLRHVSRQGASYFITFTDDYSRYGYVYLLKHKHEVFETSKVFKNEVENQLGKTIKALRSNRGGEYISQESKDYLKVCRIFQRLTPPYTPQHNGVSKRRNRTLLDLVRLMMNLTTLPLSFWDYALESATRILNMVPTKKVDKTPYKLWYGKVSNLSYLKVWGCEALVKRETPDKLQKRSVKCIFIGYPKETMGYYFYFPPKNKIVVASKIPIEVEGFEPPQKEVISILRFERTHRAPNRLCLNVEVEEHSLGNLNEPTSYKAAMLDSKSNKWIDAMNAEIQSMMDNMVWVLVDPPPGCKTVGSKWIFKKKTDMDGIVHTYKARLVAKVYTQLYGVDYEEMFSPIADIKAIRILISIAVFYDYEIWQMDVKTAFLNAYLDEDIYMVQPKSFVDPNHLRKGSESNVTFFILYVDDIIIMGNNIPSLQSVKDYLGKCFAIKYLGEAAFILGIKIYKDRSKRLIRLGQNAYMDKILKRYKMDNSKRGHIPMQERLDLNKIQGASTPKKVKRMQNVPYASAVGFIMYAIRCTRPDVAFAQNIASRFQQNPGELH